MSKLNPLHIELILRGRDPAELDVRQYTGKTTSAALSLLSIAIANPGEAVSASTDLDARQECEAIVNTAVRIAERAGLRHIHEKNTLSQGLPISGIIFEYRPE